MNRWSLKIRFGLAAACLSVGALAAGLLVIRPLIYRHQLVAVDDEIEESAEELFYDLENFRATPKDSRQPIPGNLIPVVLREHYIQIDGPDGELLHRSENLNGHDLTGEPGEMATLRIAGNDSRIGTFRHLDQHVHIGVRLTSIAAMQAAVLQATLWVAPGMGLFVFVVGWLLGYYALRPVSALTAAAEKIDARAPEKRLPLLDSSPEISRLTRVLNDSYDRLQAAYAGAARFSADASHQLKTPLAVLRAGLDNLRAQATLTPEVRSDLDALLKQTRRLTTLTEDLLLLAQMDAGRLSLETETLDLATLARAMHDDLETIVPARGIAVERELPDSLPVRGDTRRVSLILQNLAENAAKYADENGRIRIVCHAEGGRGCINIANTGKAIPPEHCEHLFERFYRAGSGENVTGHGLGLGIARALARAMEGDVRLVRSDDEWTEFQLQLPLAIEPAPSPVGSPPRNITTASDGS
jgi:signal transduction histidine kinase